jgi:Na+/melibiose symporter-like transporter
MEQCGSKREIASVFAVVAPFEVVQRILSTSLIPLLIYAQRPSSGGAEGECCVDEWVDCGVMPACGCYDADSGALRRSYRDACPASAFAASQDAACDVGSDGALGSVGTVALLVGVLSFGQYIVVGVARQSPMRPTGVDGATEPLDFVPAVRATLRCQSFRYLAAGYFVEMAADQVAGVMTPFFLLYAVGVPPLTMGVVLATTNLLTQVTPVVTLPFFRRVLRSGGVRPWDLTRYVKLLKAMLNGLYLLVARERLWPLFFVATVNGLCSGGMPLALEWMRGLTVDEDEMATGLRREGLLLSVNAVFAFMSTTFALAAVGAFGLAGYDPAVCAFAQTQAVKWYAKYVFIALPAIGNFAFFVIMRNWPLQGQRLSELSAWTNEHGQASRRKQQLVLGSSGDDNIGGE